MVLRVPDLGTGNGQTGDNEYKIRQDYNHNFTDQSNAASREVGIGDGQLTRAEDLFESIYTRTTDYYNSAANKDFNEIEVGTRALASTSAANSPPSSSGAFVYIETIQNYSASSSLMQTAWSYDNGELWTRVFKSGSWSNWRSASSSRNNYSSTTAAGANVAVNTDGKLMRSTSSERYKDILAPLELDDTKYAKAMQLKPIIYRSTADADNPSYHYYSFSAEQLGAYDPAFTLWRDTEQVTDEETGETTTVKLDERVADGLNINALLAMQHAISIKQDALIKALTARVDALELANEV